MAKSDTFNSKVPENDLKAPVTRIKGIGRKRATVLLNAGIETIEDLLRYAPRRYLDRSNISPIARAPTGVKNVTVVGRVRTFSMARGREKRFFTVVLGDKTGYLKGVWFQGLEYIPGVFSQGDLVSFSGQIQESQYGRQMIHPEFEILASAEEEEAAQDFLHTGRVVPIYPLTSTIEFKAVGLDSRGLRRIIKPVLDDLTNSLFDPLPMGIIHRNNLMELSEALYALHFPDSLEYAEKARTRLAFDELFGIELALVLRHQDRLLKENGIAFDQVGERIKKLLDKLPFELTEAQKRVIREIRRDMKSPRPMNRLLQGDVGSGKTLVALVAMLVAIENDYQAVLMAPTEILAEQHFFTIHNLLEELGIEVRLLIGGLRNSERQKILLDLVTGKAQVLIGTHALIEGDVQFANLGLVIIDEQHRFGVVQRATLYSKGAKDSAVGTEYGHNREVSPDSQSLIPDLLVMTATPIPRTLAMTVYGDLDVSILDEMPPNRKPIITRLRFEDSREKVYAFITDEVKRGRQAYIVYPLVEESEKSDLKAAIESYEYLKNGPFKDLRLDLLHGRMRSEEKERVMTAFKSGQVDILVSTTVIEVGVDVPNVTVMLIEHAERFGLSPLHQLRGRVGRGQEQSYCILMAGAESREELAKEFEGEEDTEGTSNALRRLDALVSTNDGFKIAEIDLELRGPGEFFGTKQSGLPELKIADLIRDAYLLSIARQEAFEIFRKDPHLESTENVNLKNVYLKNFELAKELKG